VLYSLAIIMLCALSRVLQSDALFVSVPTQVL